MTDINGTVVGLQGFAVNDTAPSDGYVLTWSAADGYWVPRPAPVPAATGLRKDYFTSNGTWTCPEGVTSILIIGSGGGTGGFPGQTWGSGGARGINAVQQMNLLTVVPGYSYTIIIGEGGIGGTGEKRSQADNWSPSIYHVNAVLPTPGGSTSFSYSGTTLFSVKGAALFTTPPVSFETTYNNGNNGSTVPSSTPGEGGNGGFAGPKGSGGNGGNGAVSIGGTPAVAYNGYNAEANTGAGGGGGGGCGNNGFPFTCTGGNGGNGGSGYMYIVY